MHAFRQSASSIVISSPFVNRNRRQTAHKLKRNKSLGIVRIDYQGLFEAPLVPLSVRACVVDPLFAHLASSDSKVTTDTEGVTFGGSAPGERFVTLGGEP